MHHVGNYIRFVLKRRILGPLQRSFLRYCVVDIVLVCFPVYVGLGLRLGIRGLEDHLATTIFLLPLIVLCYVATFVCLHVYDIVWRYFSLEDAALLAKGVLLGTSFTIAVTYLIDIGHFPRGAFLIESVILFISMIGVRVLRRYFHEKPSKILLKQAGRRTLIYGAGASGRALLTQVRTATAVAYNVVGFIDDNTEKVGRTIAGRRVLGTGRELKEEILARGVTEVLVAIARPYGEVRP